MAKPKFTIQPVQTVQPVSGVDRELLSKTVDDGVYPLAMAKEIRLDRLRPDPNQPRRSFDPQRLEELAASIREQGILQPIVVEYVDDGDYFRIVHGERRYRAALLAGLRTVPAIVRKSDDTTRLVRQLIENIQREDLNDVDRALALKQLKVNLGSPSWDVVAQRVGISKRRVLQLMDTTKLPESIQQAIRSGELTEKHGRAIKRLPVDRQIDFAEAVRQQGLSGDESLEVVKAIAANPELPIVEAIAQVKQPHSKAEPQPEVQARTAPVATEPAPTEPTPTEPTPTAPVPTERPQSRQSRPAVADPLADLARVPQMLDSLDVNQVDAAQLQHLLRQVIARAEALLARVEQEPLAAPEAPRCSPNGLYIIDAPD